MTVVATTPAGIIPRAYIDGRLAYQFYKVAETYSPVVEKEVRNALMRSYRDAHSTACFLVRYGLDRRGYYIFDDHLSDAIAYITDNRNIRVATAHANGLKMGGGRRAKSVDFVYNGEKISLDASNMPTFFRQLDETMNELDAAKDELAALRQERADLQAELNRARNLMTMVASSMGGKLRVRLPAATVVVPDNTNKAPQTAVSPLQATIPARKGPGRPALPPTGNLELDAMIEKRRAYQREWRKRNKMKDVA